jgi:GntR family transcriptional regulator
MTQEFNSSGSSLSENTTIPLYFQLIALIKRQIRSGMLKPGDMLPSESQFCAQFGVSRSTVRQALNQLVEEKLIIRRRGKGSFVADQKLKRNLNHLYSFTEDMISMNLSPRSDVLESSVVSASDDIIASLKLPPEQIKVFKLTRLRLANNEPILLETAHIPLYLAPDIMNEDFTSVSLYTILELKYGLNLYKAIETIESARLNKETASLLACKTSTAAFNIQRIAYLDTGLPFELTNSIARGDKCVFKVELFGSKSKVNFLRETTL